VDSGVPGRHAEESVAEYRGQHDWGHIPDVVGAGRVSGVLPGLCACNGTRGPGECGDVFGGGVGAEGDEGGVWVRLGVGVVGACEGGRRTRYRHSLETGKRTNLLEILGYSFQVILEYLLYTHSRCPS